MGNIHSLNHHDKDKNKNNAPKSPKPGLNTTRDSNTFAEDKRTSARLQNERVKRAAGLEWEELDQIQKSTEIQTLTADQEDNIAKNRYPDVKPLDHCRVKLCECDSDYINASWISGIHANSEKAYISAQAPMPSTFNDFWHMVWQENVAVITMLTNLEEANRLKAHCYWPSVDEPMTCGKLEISFVGEDTVLKAINPLHPPPEYSSTAYIIRQLQIKHTVLDQTRIIWHAHFCCWPDMSVPANGDDLISLMSCIQQKNLSSSSPMLVHCSAGIGRAGTFILIHTTLAYAQENQLPFESLQMKETLLKLRSYRSGLVQTREQYIFAVRAVKAQLDSYQAISESAKETAGLVGQAKTSPP